MSYFHKLLRNIYKHTNLIHSILSYYFLYPSFHKSSGTNSIDNDTVAGLISSDKLNRDKLMPV